MKYCITKKSTTHTNIHAYTYIYTHVCSERHTQTDIGTQRHKYMYGLTRMEDLSINIGLKGLCAATTITRKQHRRRH